MPKTKDQKRNTLKRAKDFQKRHYFNELKNSILTFNNPILSQVSQDVAKEDNLDFIEKMKKVLFVSEKGVGLAAPQIGVLKKVIVLDPKKENKIKVMINPRITEISQETNNVSEGCLSYPDIYVPVDRANKIKVEYFTTLFEKKEEEFIGFEARIIQHEVDHLIGVCLVGEVWKESKEKGLPVEEIIRIRKEEIEKAELSMK